ncbi:MAG TPA: DUF4331 domain-containing protein [Terrimicrobiaceae bacterium]
MKTNLTTLAAAFALAAGLPAPAPASSHMDAPLITRDPSANTTDVYAFVDQDSGKKSLVVALAVYPHEEPGVGPNIYNFDDNVLYEIHVATGRDLAAGRPTISYQFEFNTIFKNRNTILDSYLGVIKDINDDQQNLVQTYTVTKVNWFSKTVLGRGVVPPNNQGKATPFYNQGDDGDKPAKDGVSSPDKLDRYTRQAIASLAKGYTAFAGQRDDGFYGDINSIFDLLSLRNPGKDSQGGFNIHLMALDIPIAELGTDKQIVGVYATTSRQKVSVLRDRNQSTRRDDRGRKDNISAGPWVQVARQGNPLFNEGLVAIADKDLYSRTSPASDSTLFLKYAKNPELAKLINLLVFKGSQPAAIETDRTDIAAIYIPDLIKVDLSTPGVRFAGSGTTDAKNPDDPGFSRLSIFGGDVLQSKIQDPFGNGGLIPGGWPNGRRFGDDVVDIAVTALISDLRKLPPFIRVADGIDGVSANDIGYNKTFPYEGTPQNGRTHSHP